MRAYNTAERWLERWKNSRPYWRIRAWKYQCRHDPLLAVQLASQDESLRKRGIEIIRAGCGVAQTFGARVFLVVAGQQEPGTEYACSYETAVASLRYAVDYAADLGVVHRGRKCSRKLPMQPWRVCQFLTDVDHPAVQAYLDFGNGMGMGSAYPENWTKAVREHIAWSTSRITTRC